MGLSAHFGNSIQMWHSEHDPGSVDKNPGWMLASLMSQSLVVYVELEKIHWHLRLNTTGHAAHLEFDDPTEIAREACTVSLQLIAFISRLQRVLNPNFSPECAALFAAIKDKLAEICELADGSQRDLPEHIAPLVFRGPSRFDRTFRETR